LSSARALALFGGQPITTESRPRWPEIDDRDVDAVVAHLRAGELSAYEVLSGPLFEFEAELRTRFDSEHALLLSSGTAALQSAIFGLGLGPGDEVVAPSVTFPATASIALHFGATVRLADVDSETGNPGVEHLRSAITERTRAVIVAHAWGLPADLPSIVPFLKERGIALVEDAARAFGSRCQGREVGSFGVAGCLSFHELKAVPAGEGGVLLTADRRIYERAIALGHYFRCKDPRHLSLPDLVRFRDSGLGLNLKIHPLAACLARSQLSRLEERLTAMAANRTELADLVAGHPGYAMQQVPPWADRVSHYGFNLHWGSQAEWPSPSIKAIVKALRAEGVIASTAGSPPLFRLPVFRDPDLVGLPGRVVGRLEDSDFPGATAHVASLLRLPTLFSRNPKWVHRYASALDKVYDNREALASWEKSEESAYGS